VLTISGPLGLTGQPRLLCKRKEGRKEGREGGREEGRKGGREEGRKGGREEGRKGGREEGRKGGRKEGRRFYIKKNQLSACHIISAV
jgi:hypothetical protein